MPCHLRLRSDFELPPQRYPKATIPHIQMREILGDSGQRFLLTTFRPPEGGPPIREFVVEPFTWGWVAIMISEGILQGIGTQVWNTVFGDHTRDFTAFQLQLLERIAGIVNAAVTQDAKRQIEADLMSLQSQFRMYLNDKDEAELKPLRRMADNIVFRAYTVRLPTVASFAIVGGLELAILQEIHTKSKAEGDRKNVAEIAAGLWRMHGDFLVTLDQYNRSRFSDADRLPAMHGEPWGYSLDGRYVPEQYNSAGEAQQAMTAHRDREFDRLRDEILSPLFPVAEKWHDIAIKYGWSDAAASPHA
ncbi:hypothetical protein [Caballeronia sp. M1242]|uniref:hypothetical protein n=1 Tax=Caballeronia sp. M1242 TaxID=2814653 RepID=UPI0019D00F47|nr:hypothetical protein [Caballeronia sp. M1242]QSN60468.1 hypothetical protein JYK05_08785 [Caballeronia sp. M1242]